jgi:hypothetical protein
LKPVLINRLLDGSFAGRHAASIRCNPNV